MLIEQVYTPNPNFPHRYISPKALEKYLHENFSAFISEIGQSYLGKPIYKITLGSGKTRVLAWSQMHGNESNSTHAMLDLLFIWKNDASFFEDIFSEITLDFIFQLNPDGSEVWSRRNALDIDLNRDFLKLSSKELPFLVQLVERNRYDYALNLHEQRTIFTTDGIHPATLSFLSPSENVEREITETRKKSMAVISKIYDKLKLLIPNKIAKYTDEFYPASTGDNFTKMGIPTILYEGGFFEKDYLRKESRKYYAIALYEGLKAISELKNSTENWEKYLEIPQNRETHYDVIYRNVKLNTDFPCVLDIAIQYKEEYQKGSDEISFVPIVVEVGDCSRKKGWEEIDCTGRYFKSEKKFPKLDSIQDFEII